MSGYRAVLLVLFVVGGSLTAAPVLATGDAGADSADARSPAETPSVAEAGLQQSDAENDSTNRSLGADISSFMQSNAAEADGAVETGMWDASFNATEDRSARERLVERRTDELRAELTDLQNRKEELIAEREAGNVSDANYKAQVGQLIGRINALQSSINATERRAEQVGTNVDAVQMLETEANNLTGPEIAAVARNTTGLGNASGPPAGAGNGNGNGAPFRDANASTGNGVADPANRTSGGPPAGAGNGTTSDLPDAANGSVSGAADDTVLGAVADTPGLGGDDERGPQAERGPQGERGLGNQSDDAVGPANRSEGGTPNASVPGRADELGYETFATALSASALGLAHASSVA